MNSNTREQFKRFIESVEQLTVTIAVVAGTDAVRALVQEAEALKRQLDSDETIL